MEGCLVGGLDVVDCGLTPTPALLVALREEKAQGGLMVSGSHTPPEIAGILFFEADTGETDPSGQRKFDNLYRAEPWIESSPRKGSLRSMDVTDMYLGTLAREVSRIEGYKVVVDPGNGATCRTLPRALQAFGCTVTTINGEPNGKFPSRLPNPQPATLTELSKAVRESGSDIGVGTDSDGDRAIFATSDGHVLWGDLTGALFARDVLEGGGSDTIVATVNTSSMIKVICQEHQGRLIITKVGPPAIAEALRTVENIAFATEESGKHIWPQTILYGDAALSSGKLLEIIDKHGMSLAELTATLPTFYQLKSEIDCADSLKSRAMQSIIDTYKTEQNCTISTIDGLKSEYPDLSWFLIRASGTEPLLRCNAEGKTMEQTRELLSKANELAKTGLEKANGIEQA